LRKKLEEEGHQFETDCDTEVLVHLWEEYREQIPEFLEGMFAFSIWDYEQESVFLARDRLGIKPLYIYRSDDGLIWGSEMSCILMNNINIDINERAVYQYFSFRFTPRPETVLESIEKLPPATSLYINDENFRKRKYWQLQAVKTLSSVGAVANRVRTLLEKTLRNA